MSVRGKLGIPLATVALLALALLWRLRSVESPGGRAHRADALVPVSAASVRREPFEVWITALGTVTPRRLVSVMPRVSGLLQSVDYRQGQSVRAGQVLAQIDPRPFRIAVEQAQAQLRQTEAQLAGARHDLQRYETLLRQRSVAAQQVSDQRTTVAQLEAAVAVNRAALDTARLQLEWTRITAPISGEVGLRPVDAGNMVTASGAVGGGKAGGATSATVTPIAVIAQIQPIDVSFTVPQSQVPEILDPLRAGRVLVAQAWDARNAHLLATGRVIAAENQINASSGTLTLLAAFKNEKLHLFPNQFVNLRVLARTIPDALVVPSSAVAVGAPGSYVYVVGAGGKVKLRRVVAGESNAHDTRIVSGLEAGARVVTDGLDRLHDGARVEVIAPARPAPADAAKRAVGRN